jgi:PHD/YefM family antitoxin component YafN of YafNO toxin-antitoxin module
MLKTRERIITSKDLAEAVSTALANERREPVIVMEDGRPAAYLISVELFDSFITQLEALETEEVIAGIAAGEEQFARGEFKTLAEARAIFEVAAKE